MTITRCRRATLAVLAGLLAAGLITAGCDSPATPGPAPTMLAPATGPPSAIATRRGPYAGGPVRPPASGAYLGAWVKPVRLTQTGRVAAVVGLESAMKRQLSIVNTYRRFDEEFGTESDHEFVQQGRIIMLSWASGDTRSIVAGHHDALIRAQARRVRAFGTPIMLRFRWEMDRPNLRPTIWTAQDYVAAWRYVRLIFQAEGVRNVSWVWCPTADGFARGEAPDFYPGDDVVDWTCVDAYAGLEYRPLGDLLKPFLTWAATRPKPIVIGEFGVARAWGSAARAAWLRDAARVFKANPQIKAVAYFQSDPDGNPDKLQFSLAGDPAAFAAFRALTRDRHFNPRS